MRVSLWMLLMVGGSSSVALGQGPFVPRQPIAAPIADGAASGSGGAFARPAATLPPTTPPLQERLATPTASGGSFGDATRSRFDTATRANVGDAATPSFGSATAANPSGGLSSSGLSPTRTIVSGDAAAPRAAAQITTPAEAASPVAEMVLTQALQPRGELELPGQPLSLVQALQHTSSGGERIQAVQTYWKLVTQVAAYHAALDDRALFNNVAVQQLAAHERSVLAAAQIAATAEVRRAELEFVNTQHELVEAARLPDAQLQPLPSDAPLVSEYRTHFAALYGERAAPSGLRRLDRALPYHLQAVRAQADAVVAATRALEATANAVNSGQAGVDSLLNSHRLAARERAAMMTVVFEYNAVIAEYALHVAPGQPAETVVGMLIKTRPTERSASVVSSRVIRTVSSNEPIAADAAPNLAAPAARTFSVQDQPQEAPTQSVLQQPRQFQFSAEPPIANDDSYGNAQGDVDDGARLLPSSDGPIYAPQ